MQPASALLVIDSLKNVVCSWLDLDFSFINLLWRLLKQLLAITACRKGSAHRVCLPAMVLIRSCLKHLLIAYTSPLSARPGAPAINAQQDVNMAEKQGSNWSICVLHRQDASYRILRRRRIPSTHGTFVGLRIGRCAPWDVRRIRRVGR